MIGKTILHYKILEKLGSGGMGDVYKAEDTKLQRTVALKFLPADLTRDDEARQRFMHEARAASALDDPHIGTIYEINDTDGYCFIAMACYEGQNLKDKIAEGPMEVAEAIKITRQILSGLSKAHSKNIVHRDMKPANILLTTDNQVKIIDFGLAKLKGYTVLTKTGTTMGTIAYMSPEQSRGEAVDQRSDLWSVAVMLYEMLAGEVPFKGDYEQAIIYSIINEDPEFITKVRGEVPVELEKILEKALSKNPEKRYQSAREMLVAIESLRGETAEISGGSRRLFKLGRKQRKIMYRILAALIVLMAIVFYIFQSKVAEAEAVALALLPLQSIGQDTQEEWFTEGITEALITDLAKISGLRVISRTTAMQYKGTNKTPPQIASELGVQYVIEGSIIRMEDQIKISARLINAPKDEYLWAEEYQRGLSDILGLQSDIAQTIASQIQVELKPEEQKQFATSRIIDPAIYELYLKGKYHVNKLTPANIEKGLQYLQEALEKDPDEPLVHAGIANVYGLLAHTTSPTPDIYERSRKAALKALELEEEVTRQFTTLRTFIL